MANKKQQKSIEQRMRELENLVEKQANQLKQVNDHNRKLQQKVTQLEKRNINLNERVNSQHGILQQLTKKG